MDYILSILSAGQTTVALISFIILGEALGHSRLTPQQKIWVRAIPLALLGTVALNFHLHVVTDGVFIDLRGAAIAIATLFGGLPVGAIATVAELITRFLIGGEATVADSIGIVIAFALSAAAFHFLMKDNVENITLKWILLAGLLVGAAEAITLLLIEPFPYGVAVFKEVGIQLMSVQLISTALFGWVLKSQDDHQRNIDMLGKNAKQQSENFHQIVGALSNAMAHRDPTTAGHEKRVAEFAVAVGRHLGLDESRLEGLYLASLVHDIGQITIPTEILTRTRTLRPEEFELIKQHSTAGYEILNEVSSPWPLAQMIVEHHENFDGSGYPKRLKGDEILLEARIIRVCDSLDAMMSHRPFRKAYSKEEALAQLQLKSGSEFDPEIVKTCISFLKLGRNTPELFRGI